MSLRNRLLAAAVLLVGVGLLVANVATYGALRSFLFDRVDGQLAAVGGTLERSLAFRGGPPPSTALRNVGAVAPGAFVQVRDRADRVLVTAEARLPGRVSSSPRLPDAVAALAPDATRRPGSAGRLLTVPSLRSDDARYRVRLSAFGDVVLVVALPLDDAYATLRRLVAVEVLVSVLVLVAATGLGSWLVGLGLRPLADIETTAAAITRGDLSRRVAHADGRTEVGRLGHVLNVMLDRIDLAFAQRRASEEAARESEQRMRRFVADASHELRTPVAAVRAYAELYRMGAERNPDDLARLLARIELESTRMGGLVDDLLLLTRLEEGRALERAVVDLGAVAAEAVEAARALDPDRPLALDVAGSVEVSGDRDRLRQVVDNLLANVRAHTPARTAATVRVGVVDGRAVLEVADEGPGIAAAEAARLFERFYRADPSRSRDHGGAGLGLSIVAAIAAAHGGSAAAAPRPGGGAVFRLELPLLSDPPVP